MRSGDSTCAMPARRSAMAVALPTAQKICPRRMRKAASVRAAPTAAGLVAITMSAASALRRAARLAASVRTVIFHGDSAIARHPYAAAARRIAPWSFAGRNDTTSGSLEDAV